MLLYIYLLLSIAFASPEKDYWEKVRSQTVSIIMEEASEKPIGTGVLLKVHNKSEKDYGPSVAVITAGHVAGASTVSKLKACNETRTECVTLKGYSSGNSYFASQDWAAFYISRKDLKSVKISRISKIQPYYGMSVYQIGYPRQELFVNRATISGFDSDQLGNYLVINGFGWPGSSGGPIFDHWGELVGICTATPIGDLYGIPDLIEDQVFFVPADNIRY